MSFALYFIVISGSVHNVILEPPSMGQILVPAHPRPPHTDCSAQDQATQKSKPVVFVEGRINGQYIIEVVLALHVALWLTTALRASQQASSAV